MLEPIDAELARLARESSHRADVARRTYGYTLQNIAAVIAFGFAPLVPRSATLFGALTVAEGLACMIPGALLTCLSFVLFRTGGSESVAYRRSDAVETFFLYAGPLSIIFASRTPYSVIWILPPFSAVFFANTKAFNERLYVSVITLSHAALVLASLFRGGPEGVRGAFVAAAACFVCVMLFEVLARAGRRAVRLEAERNVLRAEMDTALLDGERERIAQMLRDRVGDAIAALATELGSDAIGEQARSAVIELHGLARTLATDAVAAALPFADFASRLDERCRPLCVDASYAQSVVGDVEGEIDAAAANALVRVSQELVRNAVTHGNARNVVVTVARDSRRTMLVVQDDGVGLSRAAFSRATGGLENARQWLREQMGSLEHRDGDVAGGVSTELRAILPRVAPSDVLVAS